MKTIADELGKLAAAIAKKAIEDNTPLAEKLDALGKLTAYYALLLKSRRASDDEDDEPTIDDMQARLRQADMEGVGVNGQSSAPAPIPARTGRRRNFSSDT